MKKTIVIILAVVVVILVVVFWVLPRLRGPQNAQNNGSVSGSVASTPSVVEGIKEVVSPQSAYDLAVGKAKQWKSDAALIKVILGDDKGAKWTFTFVSAKTQGKGYEIVVSGKTVNAMAEIPFSGGGTALPANIIAPDVAIAEARAIPGNASASFTALELVYDAHARQWYWGVTDAQGRTASVKAAP